MAETPGTYTLDTPPRVLTRADLQAAMIACAQWCHQQADAECRADPEHPGEWGLILGRWRVLAEKFALAGFLVDSGPETVEIAAAPDV